MRHSLAIILAMLACTTLADTWTRKNGKTFEAELVKSGAGSVHFKKADGGAMAMPVKNLSEGDQAKVERAAESAKSAAAAGNSSAVTATSTVTDEVKALFGDELYTEDKKKHGIDHLADTEVIGIYFSAHWCPPCRAFTPKLVEFANKMEKDGKSFEVVFVSSDRSKKDMFKYMKETDMPWVALPHGSSQKAELSNKYGIRGIPSLIIIDKDGKTLSKNGRGDVMGKGDKAYDEWIK